MAQESFRGKALSRLAIVVEGRTEEEFVNGLLRDHLRNRDIETTPILLNGNVSIDRLSLNMSNLFWNFKFVTSLVDYYGFRRRGNSSPETLQCIIDTEIGKHIDRNYDRSRVFSYGQKYEFESLLFSNTNVFDQLFGGTGQYGLKLQRIRSKFRDPEDIDDHPHTTPSRRLREILPKYRKVVDGPLIAMETGLTSIRSECARFDAWVLRLEELGRLN